jgi:hypothetical protein
VRLNLRPCCSERGCSSVWRLPGWWESDSVGPWLSSNGRLRAATEALGRPLASNDLWARLLKDSLVVAVLKEAPVRVVNPKPMIGET